MGRIKALRKQFVRQHGQSDCGAACMASIIRFYGGEKTLDEIRRLSGTTKTGTTLLGLYQSATPLGLEAVGMEADGVENLKDLDLPAILHLTLESRLQHYVVFYGFDGNQLVIGDPGKGIETWECEKLEKLWESKALLKIYPGESFEKRKRNKYAKLAEWVKYDINILIASLFLGALIALFSLTTAVFSQKLIDVILPTEDLTKLIVGLVLFGFILLVKNGLGYLRSTFLITQSRDFNNRMISSFFKSLLNLPKSFFDSKKTGEMIARMNDTRRIQTTISGLFGNLLIEFLVIITSLTGVFIYSPGIGFIVLGFIPVYTLILWRFNQPILNSQKEVMSAYAINESNYIDVINGIAEVKSTAGTGLFHGITTGLYRRFQQQVFRLGKIQIRFNVLTETTGVVLLIIVVTCSSIMVLDKQLLLGSMMAILTLSGSVGPSLTRIAIFNIQIQEARVAFERMDEFTGLKPEMSEGDKVPEFKQLRLRDLSFNFPGTLRLLEEINMTIEKGKITSILGESGSGKSTILQLIQRFYEPKNGGIEVNEKALESYDVVSLRKSMGVVSQDIHIFNNYLLFNIALSDDPKELEKAMVWCEKWGFDFYFEKFPQRYMTLLGEEGANISGGQKQLVALARALYKNPQLLLIDEGTSAMDREMEKFVLKLLKTQRQDKAILLVTHRLQIALQTDMAYLLENGKIKDSGCPKELAKGDNFLGKDYQEVSSL